MTAPAPLPFRILFAALQCVALISAAIIASGGLFYLFVKPETHPKT